jgi:hypothetical protein
MRVVTCCKPSLSTEHDAPTSLARTEQPTHMVSRVTLCTYPRMRMSYMTQHKRTSSSCRKVANKVQPLGSVLSGQLQKQYGPSSPCSCCLSEPPAGFKATICWPKGHCYSCSAQNTASWEEQHSESKSLAMQPRRMLPCKPQTAGSTSTMCADQLLEAPTNSVIPKP